MKVGFIEPSVVNVEPLGIGYLAQMLVNEGHEVKYFEASRSHFLKRLIDFRPDVLAYSVTTGKHLLSRKLNAEIRKYINAISLFGGPHCTFFPEFIESDILIDGICQGEGEIAMAELLNKMEQGGDYTDTANWSVRINGKIYKNRLSERINNLDKIAFPNREVIYAENIDLRNTPIKRILGSRGCPYACSYCFNKEYNSIYSGKGKIYRQRSVQNIIQEICDIKEKYPVNFLKFADDIFGMDMNWEEFVRLYKKEVNLPFICNIRPDLVNESKIKMLKKAGCVAVTTAVESGNDFIRNKILNRNLSIHSLDKAINALKKERIRVWTQNIIGNPHETFEMVLQTYYLNVRYEVDFAECFLLTPYPGTDIYKYCVDNKFFDGKVDALHRSYWVDSPLHYNSRMERKYIVNFQKFFSFTVQHPRTLLFIKLLIKFPLNNVYILFNRFYDFWRISRVIKTKYDIINYFAMVRNNIKFILGYLFKRY